MREAEPRPSAPRTESRTAEPSLHDLIEGGARRIVTALVIASGIIGLAIYARPAPPRFQAFAADGRIVRIDTRKGTIIACDDDRCALVLRHGQDLARHLAPKAPPQPARSRPALPAPATAPAPR